MNKKIEDLTAKLNAFKEKVRKLKSKETTERLNSLNSATVARNKSTKGNGNTYEVAELRVNLSSLKTELQKHKNHIHDLNNTLNQTQKKLKLSNESNTKLENEVSIQKQKYSGKEHL